MPRGKPKPYFTADEVVDMLRGVCEERGIPESELEKIVNENQSLFAEKKSKGLMLKFLTLQNEGKQFDEIAKDLGYQPFELRRALRPNKAVMGKLINQGVGELYILFLKATSVAHEVLDMKLDARDYKAMSSKVQLVINIWKAMGMFEKGGAQLEELAQSPEEMKKEIARLAKDPDIAKMLGIPDTDVVN